MVTGAVALVVIISAMTRGPAKVRCRKSGLGGTSMLSLGATPAYGNRAGPHAATRQSGAMVPEWFPLCGGEPFGTTPVPWFRNQSEPFGTTHQSPSVPDWRGRCFPLSERCCRSSESASAR